ncbi:hypothetical protein H4582DRAFT_2064446 [Lactarius indigo]|nr:hypothetical protein H4582DRAFT_2064446 [Lactarius indigo]
MDQAHLERKEAETVAIIAAAAAAQKAKEQRTLLEAASAADVRNKEGWQAEHERWWKGREDSVGCWGRAHCTSEVTCRVNCSGKDVKPILGATLPEEGREPRG